MTSASVSGPLSKFGLADSLYEPQVIQAVYRNAKAFVFAPTRLEFTVTMFDVSQEATNAGWIEGDIFAMHHNVLAPVNIGDMITNLASYWNKSLKTVQSEGKSTLEDFVHKPVFRSVSATLFGEAFPADKVRPISGLQFLHYG